MIARSRSDTGVDAPRRTADSSSSSLCSTVLPVPFCPWRLDTQAGWSAASRGVPGWDRSLQLLPRTAAPAPVAVPPIQGVTARAVAGWCAPRGSAGGGSRRVW